VLLTTGDPWLDRIVDAVVARANQTIRPERVWLFGSQAKGPPGAPRTWTWIWWWISRFCGRLAAEITSTGRLVYERGPA
jgi:hypothetical protein